ncbi:Subtilisin-like protease 3 [Linum perenne]
MMIMIAGLAILISLASLSESHGDSHQLNTYIVFLEKPESFTFQEDDEAMNKWYTSYLPDQTIAASSTHEEETRMIHSYRHVATGFAARLSEDEVRQMEKKAGFVSAVMDKTYSLHTTRSPDFLGLQQNKGLWNTLHGGGKGVIIGVLDTGIAPNHPSFSDHYMPHPPAKWKGKCQLRGAKCNNKLIGARNLISPNSYANDDDGHGTHTSSTAAGNAVPWANAFGEANGTAVGMAPLAHVAMYKVCAEKCTGAAILAAMDIAVSDGVDVLSLSLGGETEPFYKDPIALGTFGAMQKGVFVSCSAGNSGPVRSTMSNEAPWILTVGASTIDRKIKATVVLGSKAGFDGQSLFQDKQFHSELLPLVYAGTNKKRRGSKFCGPNTLDNSVRGKIVLCERGGLIGRVDKGQEVKNKGGIAMILINDQPNGFDTLADAHVLPASHVSFKDGQAIKSYINSTKYPTATIFFKGTIIGNPNSPQVASFSSRGPSIESPGILKPDIIGPGVDILAAWPVSVDNITNNIPFNMVSGTSMSCPHLSGIAALLKGARPNWSPAAIKSAMMTTARLSNLGGRPILDEQLHEADLYGIGAGHIDPIAAADPGLVYDLNPSDYIPYLCGLGYLNSQVSTIVNKKVRCGNSSIPEAQLNYPSFSIKLGSTPLTYSRTVTNVGRARSVYISKVVEPKGVGIKVSPKKIVFNKLNQKATFTVTFTRKGNYYAKTYSPGYLFWFAPGYVVRSPISVVPK